MMTHFTNIKAQDIEKVLKADSVSKAFLTEMLASPLVLNGQVNTRTLFYAGTSKQEPFTYLLSGNLNIGYMKYNLPLSFTFTNKNLKYAASSPLKFNRFSFSPHYKWVRLYLGSSSLSFSPYTLGGAQFKGIGAEFTPNGPFSGGFMYGKFYDAVNYNPELPHVQPVFKRTGYALKLAFNKEKVQMETSLLNATDNPQSLALPVDTTFTISALQNVAVNFKTRLMPLKAVSFDIEYAASAVNYQRRYRRESLFGLLFAKEAPINRYKAYKVDVNFNPGAVNFGASIEHIDPDYLTMGAYYSRNDFQNLTLNVASNLFRNKLNFVVNGGLENDNLKNQKQRKSTRTVGSASVNYMPIEKFNLNLAYSNFQSFSNIKNQFDYINEVDPLKNLDTLNYLQIKQNVSMSMVYKLKETAENNQVLRMVCNLNQTSGMAGQGANIINLNGNWASNKPKTKNMLAAGFNSTFIAAAERSTYTYGPVLSWTQPFLDDKMAANASLAYNQSFTDNTFTQANLNLRGAVDYTYREIHKFRLELAMMMRKQVEKPFASDYRLTLSYTLAFKKRELYLSKNQKKQVPINNTTTTK